MMLLHIALQVLLEYRHIFNSEENAVLCSFLLRLLCIPSETSPVLNLRTLLSLSLLKWQYWRQNYLSGIFYWNFWTRLHPRIICWHLSLKSQHIPEVEKQTLTKYQINSFHFILNSIPQSFSGSVSPQPQ